MNPELGNILVDATEFMHHFRKNALQAKNSLYVQAMTFEGDAAGSALIDIMKASPAKDKRLCIDSYSKYVINDQFVFGAAWFKPEAFRQEIKAGEELLKEAKAAGIQVKSTNPMKWLPWRYPCRNHKKMVVIDEKIAYVGGINFSDHNFAWHDCMLVWQYDGLGRALAEDFLHTWKGVNQSAVLDFGQARLFLLNGAKSRQEYQQLFALISSAKKELTIISPYVSDPLLSLLKTNIPHDVELKIISPADNNKSIFKHYLYKEMGNGYFRLFQYQKQMSHLKAILIDDEVLILGSSNYDFASYYFEQEVVVAIKDKSLINAFKKEVLLADMAESVEVVGPAKYNRAMALAGKLVPPVCYLLSKAGLRPH